MDLALGVYSWSTTAGNNGSASSSITFAEGQSPASLNNSARALMAEVKGWLDAIGGSITYGGSADAYTATHNAVAAWSAYASGQIITLVPGATNTGASTLNVDGLGTKAICKGASTALSAGDLTSGYSYLLRYDGTRFVIIGSPLTTSYQPLDATLTALAALSWSSGRPLIEFTAADTISLTLAPSVTSVTASGAVTAGSYEFGGGTDATVTRSAAGRIAVEGVDVQLVGKKAIPIPASAMVANTTNGPASSTNETTTNDVMYRTLDFDTTTQESAQFLIPMPSSWNEGTVTFQACWTAASGSGGVAWDLAGLALSDDDALDQAFGTEQVVTDTLIATGDVHWTAESSAITIGGSPAANDLVVFRVRRVPANGSDTLAADAKLIAIRLFITTNDSVDA